MLIQINGLSTIVLAIFGIGYILLRSVLAVLSLREMRRQTRLLEGLQPSAGAIINVTRGGMRQGMGMGNRGVP